MKNRMPRRSHFTVFRNFLLSYLLLTLVVATPLFPLYASALLNAKQSTIKDSYSMLERGFLSIENEILALNDMAISLRLDSNYSRLARTAQSIPPGDVYNLVRAKQLMVNWGFPPDIVFSNLMVFRRNRMAISRTQIITDLNDLYGNFLSAPSMGYEEWLEYVFDNDRQISFKESVAMRYRSYITDEYNTADMIYCILSLPIEDARRYDSAMVVMIHTQRLLESLATQDILDSGFLYITNADGEIIYRYQYDQPALALSPGISEMSWQEDTATIMHLGDSRVGLSVVAGIPNGIFTQKVSNISRLLMTYVLLAIAIGIALAYWLAYRSSRPINGIIETIGTLVAPAPKAVNRNGYDYIRNSLMQIDDTSRRYQNQLEAMYEDIRGSLTQKVLAGRFCDERETSDFRRYFDLTQEAFAVMVCTLPDSEEPSMDERDAQGVHLALAKAAAQQLGCRYVLHGMSWGHWVVIANFSSAQRQHMQNELQKVYSQVLSETGLNILVGVSHTCNRVEEIGHGYWQARQALRQIDGEGGPEFCVYKRMNEPAPGNVFSPHIAQKLSDLIPMGEVGAIEELFDAVRSRMEEQNITNPADTRQILLTIRNTLSHAASQIGKDGEAQADIAPYREGDRVVAAMAELKQSALRLAQRAQRGKKSRNTELCSAVLGYIEQNYSDPALCAAQVAEQHGLSEKYLYNFIKGQTGKAFGEYVEALRLKEAERLLCDLQLPINCIPGRVGFNSVNTFYKTFKRCYGTSPGNWRTHHALNKAQGQDEC